MPVYIALLRGINVGAQKKVAMKGLIEVFELLGFESVKTYIQSGNAVFRTNKTDTKVLKTEVESAIQNRFGFQVPVLLLSKEEIQTVVRDNPFLKVPDKDNSKLYVTFLSEIPSESSVKKISELASSPDEFYLLGKEVYLYCPEGYGRTKLSNDFFEKKLSVQATTRNWKTCSVLAEMGEAT